jgi:hypothetical protein
MRSMSFVAIAAYLALATQAWAEGALAVGCTSDGTIVWGAQFGERSLEVAQSKALQRCQAKGSDCSLLRTGLRGDGAWIALATDPTVPAPHCLPVGQYYSASKETAERMAVAACQKNGGRNCQISFIRQNKGETTYTIVPGTGGVTAPPTFSNHCPPNTVDRGAAGCRPSY